MVKGTLLEYVLCTAGRALKLDFDIDLTLIPTKYSIQVVEKHFSESLCTVFGRDELRLVVRDLLRGEV